MQIYRLGEMTDKKEALRVLGVESSGVSIMSKKMSLYYFMIKNLRTPAANILKQDALSIGAELAVPSGVITCEKEVFDCMLIGNKKQIEILSRKELTQPFGLKAVAQALSEFLSVPAFPLRIMGVLNANDDSFYEESRYLSDDAIVRIEQMIEEGAEVIDVGAVSSRPGAAPVDAYTELERIKPICDAIVSSKLYKKALFSIDSYAPSVVEYALQSGFSIINDITGASDSRIVVLAVKYDASLCVMHMQGTPKNMQKDPTYQDVVVEVSQFFAERIAYCETLGLDREKIILDIGIGFGKRLEDNIALIKNLSHFQKFGCELLVGASRKSMIDHIVSTPIKERLAGTLAIHLQAISQGAHMIRCHDVKAHRQAISVHKAFC